MREPNGTRPTMTETGIEKWLDELVAELLRLDAARPEEIRGCTEQEIGHVLAECPFGSPPPAYVGFMRRTGRAAGNLFRGSDIHYPNCLGAREYAAQCKQHEDPNVPLGDRFYFGHHQGYVLYYFQPEDERVWTYTLEGDGEKVAAGSFRAFVAEHVGFRRGSGSGSANETKRTEPNGTRLMQHYQVVKDDQVFGAWTSVADVGDRVAGTTVTWEDYRRAEDAYVSAIRLLSREVDGEGFILRWPELHERHDLGPHNFYDGAMVTGGRAEEIARWALREEGVWCALTRPGRLVVSFGFDFQLRVSSSVDISTVRSGLDSLGLQVHDAPQYAEVHEGEDGVEYLAAATDNAFWNAVADHAARPGHHLLCETWAGGRLGVIWYRLVPGTVESIRERVHSRSLVTAYFDVATHSLAQARHALSGLVADDPAGLADRAWLCAVEQAGSPVVDVARCEAAADLRAALPDTTAAEMSVFAEPDDAAHDLEAVVPDPDGTVVPRWLASIPADRAVDPRTT